MSTKGHAAGLKDLRTLLPGDFKIRDLVKLLLGHLGADHGVGVQMG